MERLNTMRGEAKSESEGQTIKAISNGSYGYTILKPTQQSFKVVHDTERNRRTFNI